MIARHLDRPVIAGLLCLAMACIGCKARHHPVSGHVTLDGEPLAGAHLSFICPEDPRVPPVFATTDTGGRYELRESAALIGLRPANYRVRIWTSSASEDDADAASSTARERIPPRYNIHTELTANVTPGAENIFNFALLSPAP